MPFVLKHQKTAEIFACRLINHYDLPYFGVKYWDDPKQAEEEAADFLKGQGAQEPDAWEVLEVEEHRVKLFNVKLANDENRKIFLDGEGRITVSRHS